MNPYEKFLEGRDARAVISETPQKLSALAHKLGAEGLKRKPAPDKWSAAEILCHLADCEVAFAFRLRQALAEEHHVIQPFDQDRWARDYAALEPAVALQTFTVLRSWNLCLLDAIKPEEFAKKVSHPERGEMTFQTVVETMGGHDLNHQRQLEALAAAQTPAAGE